MWLIIDKKTRRVFAIETVNPPEGAYNTALFDTKEWDGDVPRMANPFDNVEADLDPTLGDPTYQEKCRQWQDFKDLEKQIVVEATWLNEVIPQIYIMSEAQLRSVVKQLAQENLQMIKAWRYMMRR